MTCAPCPAPVTQRPCFAFFPDECVTVAPVLTPDGYRRFISLPASAITFSSITAGLSPDGWRAFLPSVHEQRRENADIRTMLKGIVQPLHDGFHSSSDRFQSWAM